MQSFTIDASIALKWVSTKNESNISEAGQLFARAINRKIVFSAPTLLKVEVANILLKKKKIRVKECHEAIETINKANISYIELTDTLVKEAVRQSSKYNLSVYDGVYVATSYFLENQLLSADEKGHGKIKGVILLKNLDINSIPSKNR